MLQETEEEWWHNAGPRVARLECEPAPAGVVRYRIGDGYLDVRSGDNPFRARLERLFRECAVPLSSPAGLPTVTCAVRDAAGARGVLVSFDDPEPLDQLDFILKVFPDRGYAELPGPGPGWRGLGIPAAGGLDRVAVDDTRLWSRADSPWQSLAGSLAVQRLLRLQRGTFFFHAGAVALGGQGCMLVGPKGSGKTTLSLALAARGARFLGDEFAAVRVATRELLPVRRSLAVRDGPAAAAVIAALERLAAPSEPFPDGHQRRRAYADQLFPDVEPEVTRLSRMIFLRGFEPAPRLVPVQPDRQQLALLTPLGASLWGRSPAETLRDLLALVTAVQCAMLWLGPPEPTAECLANWVEG